MNESDIEKIDYDELSKQRKEAILATGEYVSVEIIIGSDDYEPITSFKASNITDNEIAYMILALNETKKQLCKKFPKASYIAENNLKVESIPLGEIEEE